MNRNRTNARQLGYAVTGTILAVSLSGCGLFQGSSARVASAPEAGDDAMFVDAGQAANLQALLDEARAEARAEAGLASARAVPTKKERRAAHTRRAEAPSPVADTPPASGDAAVLVRVEQAEAAVLAAPLDAALRTSLAQTYLAAGRFDSASASFADAAVLAAPTAQIGLQHALALMGRGNMADAVQLLEQHQADLPVADLGLAFALAGETDRAIAVLSDAIRSGESTVKMRQNLAYSYALANRWRHARVMAAQDVPAHEINQRIEEWSLTAHPDAGPLRISNLLNVPAHAYDRGMPLELALSNFTADTLLAERAAGDRTGLLAPVAETAAQSTAAPGWAPAVSAPQPALAAEIAQAVMILAENRADLGANAHADRATAASPMGKLPELAQAATPTGAAVPLAAGLVDSVDAGVPMPAPLQEPASLVSGPQAPAVFLAQHNLHLSANTHSDGASPADHALGLQKATKNSASLLKGQACQRGAAARARTQVQADASPAPAAVAVAAPDSRSGAARRAQGVHSVQLGSFLSERDARRAVETYRSRYTSLRGRDLEITEALVRGKRYFRVSATGYSLAASKDACSEVQQAGEGCLPLVPGRAMPGAIARGRRFVRLG